MPGRPGVGSRSRPQRGGRRLPRGRGRVSCLLAVVEEVVSFNAGVGTPLGSISHASQLAAPDSQASVPCKGRPHLAARTSRARSRGRWHVALSPAAAGGRGVPGNRWYRVVWLQKGNVVLSVTGALWDAVQWPDSGGEGCEHSRRWVGRGPGLGIGLKLGVDPGGLHRLACDFDPGGGSVRPAWGWTLCG